MMGLLLVAVLMAFVWPSVVCQAWNKVFNIRISVNGNMQTFVSEDFPTNLERDALLFCSAFELDASCPSALCEYVLQISNGHFNYSISYEKLSLQTLAVGRDYPIEIIQSNELDHGNTHYRSIITDPKEYGSLGASQFTLLFHAGLKDYHSLLEIGCGPLSLGRLVMPYLDFQNYVCLEPLEWLVASGLRFELGGDIVGVKRPAFSNSATFQEPGPSSRTYDFIVVEWIFCHGTSNYIYEALSNVSNHMHDNTVLLATFCVSRVDEPSPYDIYDGWLYPTVIEHAEREIKEIASAVGLHTKQLQWKHPRQTWFVLAKAEDIANRVERRLPKQSVDVSEYFDKHVRIFSREIALARRNNINNLEFDIDTEVDINRQLEVVCTNIIDAVLKGNALATDDDRFACLGNVADIVHEKLLRSGHANTIAADPAADASRMQSMISSVWLMQLAEVNKKIYQQANPFSHIYFDDLFPVSTVHACSREFPEHAVGSPLTPGWGERLQFPKQYRKRYLNAEALMGPYCKQIIHFMKSSTFLKFLERLTGISGLLADPHFEGGGLHQTQPGGMLKIHQDFNFSNSLGLWRRINVFLFLNEEPEWKETGPNSYGGRLELWDSDVKTMGASIAPIINRLLVMKSTGTFHGHPDPLPGPVSRKSIALYYYTVSIPDPEPPRGTTVFKERPGESF